jgi:hypothetical protein
VRQGHDVPEPGIDAIDPPPDLRIERIGDLLDHDLSEYSRSGFRPDAAAYFRFTANSRRSARIPDPAGDA